MSCAQRVVVVVASNLNWSAKSMVAKWKLLRTKFFRDNENSNNALFESDLILNRSLVNYTIELD